MSTAPAPDVSILIVAYNSQELIAECLAAIPAACASHSYEVLLVDNGNGETAGIVASDFPDVRVIPGQGNIGFAAGNNLLAREARAPMLLLINPDLVLFEGAIDALIAGAERHSRAAAWGGVTLNQAGKPDSGNAIAVPSLAELASVALGRSIAGSRPVAGLQEDASVPTLSGGFVMFASKVWQEAGGLDERYFLYCEEVDLFYRLSRKGYSFWRIASARAFHDIGHGTGHSPTRQLYRAAGLMQFVRTHWTRPAAAFAFLLLWIAALERYFAGALIGRWRPSLAQMAAGYELMALKPHYWWAGYDPHRGLLTRMAAEKEQKS